MVIIMLMAHFKKVEIFQVLYFNSCRGRHTVKIHHHKAHTHVKKLYTFWLILLLQYRLNVLW